MNSLTINIFGKDAQSLNFELMTIAVRLAKLNTPDVMHNLYIMPLVRMLCRLTNFTNTPCFDAISQIDYEIFGDIEILLKDNPQIAEVLIADYGDACNACVITVLKGLSGHGEVIGEITKPSQPTSELIETFRLFVETNNVTTSGQLYEFGYISEVLSHSTKLGRDDKVKLVADIGNMSGHSVI